METIERYGTSVRDAEATRLGSLFVAAIRSYRTLGPLRSARISRSQYDLQSGFGRSDSPIKYSSIAEAAPLPSAIAQTTSD